MFISYIIHILLHLTVGEDVMVSDEITLQLDPESLTRSVSFRPLFDIIYEGDEDFFVQIVSATGAEVDEEFSVLSVIIMDMTCE